MFERLIEELKENNGITRISVPVKADNEGYLDKECPDKKYLFQFKVFEDDWEKKINKNNVYCPLCRHEAKSDSWWTTEQLKHAEEQAFQHFRSRIDEALEQGARDFNSRQQSNSFIKMSMSLSGTQPFHYMIPTPAQQEMFLKIQCSRCSCKYAVIGSAFFCPYCGHNSADETFDNSIKKIEAKLKNLHVIRKAVEAISKDEAETTCRSLIETSLNESVVAFQRFCEITYVNRNPSAKVKFNAFQNIDMGNDYWNDLYSENYTDWLSPNEYQKMIVLFQKRHLLSHTEGIVDQKYIDKSHDNDYYLGQRIVIKEKDVNEILHVITKIISVLRNKA